MDWLKKLAGYAPDIVGAIASGGATLPATALRIVSKELLGYETDNADLVSKAVMDASPEQMVEMTKANNQFKAEMARLSYQDKQKSHETTQETIRNGDNSNSTIVKLTRPLHATGSLIAAIAYAFTPEPSMEILGLLLALPFTYSGLRQLGKWKTTDALTKVAK
ncbi:hypothetical protein VPH219E481_0053 [Vibrio phage 219E48-1]|nr:hypothetical protein PODOV021v1_p0041 [Vibrio phage 219E41.2]QZI91092.1 hypothetical protein PODOV032v1_p0087 [Vibrio phage 219E41.1]